MTPAQRVADGITRLEEKADTGPDAAE